MQRASDGVWNSKGQHHAPLSGKLRQLPKSYKVGVQGKSRCALGGASYIAVQSLITRFKEHSLKTHTYVFKSVSIKTQGDS